MISREYRKTIRYLQWSIFFEKNCNFFNIRNWRDSLITIEKSLFSGHRLGPMKLDRRNPYL